MTEHKIKLTPDDAEALRRKLIVQICDGIQGVFDEHPQIRSADLYIAQYWNDNASDEVHARLVYSVHEHPMLPDDLRDFWFHSSDTINLPDRLEHKDLFQIDDYWESMRTAVTAFACYCEEDGSQHRDGLDGYSCYARFTRSDGVATEIVGIKHRPWLDGVKPDSE